MSGKQSLAETPVLILAGGLGTRLRPVLSDRPKGLAPIADRPFLEVQIDLLRQQGAHRFVLCTGHLAEMVRARLGDGSALGVRIEHSVEQSPLGTAGALRLAERFFHPRALVLNGDTYLDIDYEQLFHHHLGERQSGTLATVALAHSEDASRYGSVLLDASGRFLAGFREKSTDTGIGWLNAGAYMIERELLERIPAGVAVSLERDVFPAALADGVRLAGWTCQAAFHDIGTPESLMAFTALYERMRHGRRAG